ncbi:YbhN family protein [Halobium salinum]|uniref:YbhN family protein n=1 Tax=Halobium salinum TaxID=1364940 RepID=A0ABD5PCN0_9EURY|nr:lysylphosphatidylglycerol synthase transmembrane domain-containing protein [Halobium salinum]
MNASVDRKTVAKALAGFVVAGVVLYLFGRVIGWAEITRTLRDANFAWVAAACGSSLLCLLVWSKSWDVILHLLDVHIPWRSLVPTYLAATFADYVTPFGKAGGSPFIAYILSADDRANYQESLAGVVTADLLNLLPFFTFAGVGFVALLVQNRVPQNARGLIVGLAVLAVAMPLIIYLSYRRRDFVEGLVVKVVGPIARRTERIDAEKIRDRVDGFYDRIDIIGGNPRVMVHTLVYAFVGWVLFAAPLYLSARSLGITIDPLIVLFIVPASTLAGVTPTPGGLGGVEAAIVGLLVALTPLGTGTAAAVALLYRVASYWFVVLVGGVATGYEIYAH